LGANGLLLTPTVASTGWLADGRLDEHSAVHGLPPEVYSTAMQNVTGNPALSVPMGTLATGLPFGLQITAPHFHDDRLLGLAALVEGAFPWARTAPGYDGLDTILGDR
jgi:Asp-tRNA(Asn)/Glu-tRNA(Gln) amidotransferase A subunit family amidase